MYHYKEVFAVTEPDRLKLSNLIRERSDADHFYREHSSVYRAFLEMESEAYRDGALRTAQKELIAVGISVVINCESCMEWHIGQALAAGATADQVVEAIGVGMEMGGGPATVSARFAMKALAFHTDE